MSATNITQASNTALTDDESISFKYFKTIGIVVLLLTTFLGSTFNAAQAYVIARAKELHTISHMLVLNLAVADFFIAVVGATGSLYNFSQPDNISLLAGRLEAASVTYFGLACINILAFLSVVRYVSMTQARNKKKIVTRLRAVLATAACWFFPLIWCLGPFFNWGEYGPNAMKVTFTINLVEGSSMNLSYVASMFILNFLLPLLIIGVCYFFIFSQIRHLSRAVDQSSQVGQRSKKREVKLAITCLIMIAAFLFSWLPYAITALVALSGVELSPLAAAAPALFAKTSCLYNPIVYLLFNSDFRRAARHYLVPYRRPRLDGREHSTYASRTEGQGTGTNSGSAL